MCVCVYSVRTRKRWKLNIAADSDWEGNDEDSDNPKKLELSRKYSLRREEETSQQLLEESYDQSGPSSKDEEEPVEAYTKDIPTPALITVTLLEERSVGDLIIISEKESNGEDTIPYPNIEISDVPDDPTDSSEEVPTPQSGPMVCKESGDSLSVQKNYLVVMVTADGYPFDPGPHEVLENLHHNNVKICFRNSTKMIHADKLRIPHLADPG